MFKLPVSAGIIPGALDHLINNENLILLTIIDGAPEGDLNGELGSGVVFLQHVCLLLVLREKWEWCSTRWETDVGAVAHG